MKIAIAGYGIEGKANFDYWNTPENEVTVVDERETCDTPEGVKTILGDGAFSKLQDFDMVIRTAGVAPNKIVSNGKIWSATNEFFATCPATIIGVTGTKGKGTTASLIASVLKEAGKTVHLVGNIGTPALEVLAKVKPDDIVVFELSSFQLWDLERSPHVAVVLMIEPDHLDVHKDFDEYLAAKANIRRFQKLDDVCLYHPTNPYSREIATAQLVNLDADEYGGSLEFAQRYAIKDDDQVYVENGFFCVQNRKICSTDNLKLPGRHNLENACAAMSAVSELWLNVTDEEYAEGLSNFTGLPHRLKFVAEKNGVKYYDDSIATTPGSAIVAIDSFEPPKILLLGGREKGNDYAELIKKCAENQVRVVAYGENREQLKTLCDQAGVVCQVVAGNMFAVVVAVASSANPGDVVLLSPAAASFDMFKNYAERGDEFIEAVEKL